jgi:hypothetical protein
MDERLKSVLNAYGNEPDWEIYRGDSFQLVVDPADARNSVATKGYQNSTKH